jgi:hypothetical protein
MTTIRRLIYIHLSLFLLVGTVTAQRSTPTENSYSIDTLVSDEQVVLYLLRGDQSDVSILLHELQLVGQENKLEQSIRNSRKQLQVSTIQRAISRENPSSYGGDNDIATLSERIYNDLSEILLPHQIERLKQVVYQIKLQREYSVPYFKMPLMIADRINMDKGVIQHLRKRYELELKEYEREIKKRYQLGLSEIKNASPDELNSVLPLLLSSEFSRVSLAGHARESEVAWTDKQKELVEMSRAKDLVKQILAGHPDVANEFALSRDQEESIRLRLRDFNQKKQELGKQHRQEWLEVQLLRENGDRTWVERNEILLDKETALIKEYLDPVLSEILLPFQSDRLKQIAKRSRILEQLKYSDEFGVPLVIAQEIGLKEHDCEQLKEKIAEVRSDFYQKLVETKSKCWDEIRKQLPPEGRERFDELLGEPFDYEHERFKYLSSSPLKM